jgi:thiosulfate reductase/polysulfide reductase chain A
MPDPSRRRFLKITASMLAAAGVAGKLGGAVVDRVEKIARSGVRKIPTLCDLCFWKCGAIAYVRDGQLWKIEGNPADPLSRGRLCPRGTGGVGAHNDPDRLR